jgi:hypothetical protein
VKRFQQATKAVVHLAVTSSVINRNKADRGPRGEKSFAGDCPSKFVTAAAMSYGADQIEPYRRMRRWWIRFLKELSRRYPVEQPRSSVVVNLKTSEADRQFADVLVKADRIFNEDAVTVEVGKTEEKYGPHALLSCALRFREGSAAGENPADRISAVERRY